MRLRILSCVISLLLLFSNGVQAQYRWHFDKVSKGNFQEASGRQSLLFNSGVRVPDLMPGVKGKALRTDGYSVYLSSKLPPLRTTSVNISGWFALESYPTDTAGFFSIINRQQDYWVSACVDRFGVLMVGLHSNGRTSYFPSVDKLSRFSWVHVGLAVANNKVELFINGNRQLAVAIDFNPAFRDLLIGRDAREKSRGIFPVTLINGLIDEIQVSNGPLVITPTVKQEIAKAVLLQPDLSIPESRFATDFNRPLYHLLPAANWTNETHGLIYYGDEYHIFNQKNASNLFLGQINWGHFSSRDLVSWTEHRPVLTPEPGYDEKGIWSGHVIKNEEGTPTIVYTAGGQHTSIAIAFPKDSTLNEWIKYSGNPVVTSHPAGYTRTDMRDPYVWKEGNKWYMIVGYGIKQNDEERGALLLYSSTNLKNWAFLHTLFEGNPSKDSSGIFWEMPAFVKMNDKYVLSVNRVPHNGIPAMCLYWTGSFINERFIPDDSIPKKLEVINRLLSPSVSVDKKGFVTSIGIIPDEIGSRAAYQNGWTHVYSIPRVWNLVNGKICQQPHPGIQQLREHETIVPGRTIVTGKSIQITSNSHQQEIQTEFSNIKCKRFGLIVGKSADNTEFTKIYFDFDKQQLVIDQTRSSKRQYIPLDIRTGFYKVNTDDTLKLRLFIDGSVVEGFINDQDAFTTRIFPLSSKATLVEAFVEQGSVYLNRTSVWTLRSSNNKADFKSGSLPIDKSISKNAIYKNSTAF